MQNYKIVEANKPEDSSPDGKRKNAEGPPAATPSPAKRARTDANIASKDITASLMHKVSLGKGMPELHLRTGSNGPCAYLVATHSEGEKSLPEHTFLGGFGAGSFKIEKDDTPEEETPGPIAALTSHMLQHPPTCSCPTIIFGGPRKKPSRSRSFCRTNQTWWSLPLKFCRSEK